MSDPVPEKSEMGKTGSERSSELAEVAVLGAAAVDWVARVEAMPPLDGIAFASQYTPFVGGSGGNVAEAIARLGHRTRFLGALGDDESGRLLLQAFIDAGVNTNCIQIKAGERSAATFIAVDRQGQRMIIALGGTALYDSSSEILHCQLEQVKILFIADIHNDVASTAISRLNPAAKVIFNPGGWMTMHGKEFMRPILARSHLLILNRVEAEALTDLKDPSYVCQALSASGPEAVILTLGERGALVYEHGRIESVPAVPVEEVVDTTGAGDAFSAGLVAGLLEGKVLAQAARLGCAVAAHKIRHFGSRSGLPSREQVRAWL